MWYMVMIIVQSIRLELLGLEDKLASRQSYTRCNTFLPNVILLGNLIHFDKFLKSQIIYWKKRKAVDQIKIIAAKQYLNYINFWLVFAFIFIISLIFGDSNNQRSRLKEELLRKTWISIAGTSLTWMIDLSD